MLVTQDLFCHHLQDEIAEMKRKFKIMNHQIEQLKEEIQQKGQAYIKVRASESK